MLGSPHVCVALLLVAEVWVIWVKVPLALALICKFHPRIASSQGSRFDSGAHDGGEITVVVRGPVERIWSRLRVPPCVSVSASPV